MNLFGIAALAVGLVACVTDVRSRRIPNVLTFGASAAALVAYAATDGTSGMATAATGWLAGAALFMPFFLLGGMGAGDVKLLAALGAWIGPGDAVWLALYSALAGGLAALVVALRHRYLKTAFRNVFNLATYWWLVGLKPMPQMTLERSDSPRLAYAIPIFMGTVATLWLR